jgi:hypothetical protein
MIFERRLRLTGAEWMTGFSGEFIAGFLVLWERQ